jgi:V/A-type H+-transporting ATPase subunit E
MSQQIQELIDKIKSEGVQAADKKAKEIENAAQTNARKTIADAQNQAKHIIADAQSQAQRTKESTEMALKQVARDTLLALRKEIESALQKVVAAEIKDSLSAEQLADILKEIIKRSTVENAVEVVVSPEDLQKMKAGLIAKLQKEIKQPVTFRSNDGIRSGFTISFDEGKSRFDFTDASLVAYLSSHLNAHVASLLNA